MSAREPLTEREQEALEAAAKAYHESARAVYMRTAGYGTFAPWDEVPESSRAVYREHFNVARDAYERTALARVTHGRHCPCSACAREDWTNPKLAPCGMHGPTCPARYAPITAASEDVEPDDLLSEIARAALARISVR